MIKGGGGDNMKERGKIGVKLDREILLFKGEKRDVRNKFWKDYN